MVCLFLFATQAVAQGPVQRVRYEGWPGVFNPQRVLNLHLTLTPGDWSTIQNDESLSIELPGWFWADGEAPILVGVRRKSGDALQSGGGFRKVSLKIDINEYTSGLKWRDLTKVSLENGDDQDVLAEGLAWHMHRLASVDEGYGYEAGMAAWVTMEINGTYTGVYVNAEQRNKQFLRNRDLYTPGETWLYKISDPLHHSLEVGAADSPTVTTLCYYPFVRENQATCSTPDVAVLETQLDGLIDMDGMFTMTAIDAILGNPDALFSHGKNCYFVDFLGRKKRMYFPWDQDSVVTGTDFPIYYDPNEAYPATLFPVPAYLARYTEILRGLIEGPLEEQVLIVFLDQMEPILSDILCLDPNNQIGDAAEIAERFDDLRAWVPTRYANIQQQLP